VLILLQVVRFDDVIDAGTGADVVDGGDGDDSIEVAVAANINYWW